MRSLPQTGEDGRQETRKDAAIRTLIESEVNVPEASDEECERFYDNNPERCKSETIFEARHILIAVKGSDEKDWETAYDNVNGLISIITADPGKFGKFAREMSMCPSAKNGGNLGQVTAGNTVPEFEIALCDMAAGSISNAPVKSRYGYHIIALDRKIDGQVLPFDTIKERLKAWLEAVSWSKAVAQYLSILVGKSKITGIDLHGADSPLIQ
jgi:peptidyl-prolyl cis-trans isomerase C